LHAGREATIKVAAAYPRDTFYGNLGNHRRSGEDFGIYAEWSINEIVAAEVAAGASMAGVRSIVSMKAFVLNVAADAANDFGLYGVEGGMVIAVCDDPALHSSQKTEQYTRFFAVTLSCLFWTLVSPQEAHDMANGSLRNQRKKYTYPLSFGLLRGLAHGKARVKLGEFQKN